MLNNKAILITGGTGSLGKQFKCDCKIVYLHYVKY